MAISISSAFNTAVQKGERYGAVLFTFYFEQTYGIWTASGERNYNGVIYRGGGSAIEMGQIENNSDGSVSEMTLTLSTSPDKGLTSDVLATFYDTSWRNQLVTIDIVLFDPDDRAIIDKVSLFRGTTIQAPYTEGVSSDKIELTLNSRSIALSGTGGAYRNNQSQQRIDPTDTSLVNIGILSDTITASLNWGQS